MRLWGSYNMALQEKVTWVISPLSLVELWANGTGPSARGDVENTASGCKVFTVLENSYCVMFPVF